MVRLGADIGVRCLGCGRRLLLERVMLERRMKEKRPGSLEEAPAELAPARFLSREGQDRRG